MTTLAAATSAIRARLAANWTTTAVAWPNEKFAAQETPWVAVEIRGSGEEQLSIGAPGANLFRAAATLWLHVFVKRNTSDATALAYAEQLAAIFRGQSFSGVLCQAASIYGGDEGSEDGKWWRRSVAVPFDFDATA